MNIYGRIYRIVKKKSEYSNTYYYHAEYKDKLDPIDFFTKQWWYLGLGPKYIDAAYYIHADKIKRGIK